MLSAKKSDDYKIQTIKAEEVSDSILDPVVCSLFSQYKQILIN